METNSVLDRYILNWCQQHGWEYPQKENGIWYAIAPNDYIPKPVLLSQSLELLSQQVAAALGVNTSTARESLQCEALNRIDWGGAFGSLCKILSKTKLTLENVQGKSTQTVSEKPEALKQNRIKRRDEQNQKMMRSFLESRFARSRK